jgi:hypothetical protein
MATLQKSYANAAAHGVPAFEVLDVYVDANLIAGAEPAMQSPTRLLLADLQTLAAFTVVGFDATGRLVKAVWNATLANAIKPIGVLLHAATSGASNTTIFGEVFLTGNFNVGVDAVGTESPLVWDASFDTVAKKTTWQGLPIFNGNPNLKFGQRLIA